MRMSIFLPALMLCATPAAAQNLAGCGRATTQADMTDCAQREYAVADRQLTAVWKRAQAWARENDRTLDRSFDKRPTYSARLLDAQRGWIAYKDAQCDVEGWSSRGGSMEPMLYAMCRRTLTRQRIKDLNAMIASGG